MYSTCSLHLLVHGHIVLKVDLLLSCSLRVASAGERLVSVRGTIVERSHVQTHTPTLADGISFSQLSRIGNAVYCVAM